LRRFFFALLQLGVGHLAAEAALDGRGEDRLAAHPTGLLGFERRVGVGIGAGKLVGIIVDVGERVEGRWGRRRCRVGEALRRVASSGFEVIRAGFGAGTLSASMISASKTSSSTGCATTTGSGHVTRVAQMGHFLVRPAESGRALSALPQPTQGNVIFMAHLDRRPVLFRTPSRRAGRPRDHSLARSWSHSG
jgi:hypothetical protein